MSPWFLVVRSTVGVGMVVDILEFVFPEIFPHALSEMRHTVRMLKSIDGIGVVGSLLR